MTHRENTKASGNIIITLYHNCIYQNNKVSENQYCMFSGTYCSLSIVENFLGDQSHLRLI